MLRDLKYFLLLSRPANVLIAVLSFGIACYIANDRNGSLPFLQHGPFWGTVLSIVLIAATGYWINDVYDFRIDRINKPRSTIVNGYLSVKKVLTAYFITVFFTLLFSILYLGIYAGKPGITFINFLSVILLFWYASHLKRVSVAGNLLVSFLIFLVIILAGYLYRINMPLIWVGVFAFEITFIREITKDIEDIKGDLQYKLHTLPIQVGIRSTKKVLTVLYLLFILSCYLPFFYRIARTGDPLWRYLLLSVNLVQVPALLLMRMMLRSSHPRDFAIQSRYLKYLMLTGIITLLFLK
ncbi:MAG: hypothetical protein D6730_12410 [Bacteroidetes bacterium]|nr:MAG: hypothetical protein D6730_12410 [Bacteroidota bacterium]